VGKTNATPEYCYKIPPLFPIQTLLLFRDNGPIFGKVTTQIKEEPMKIFLTSLFVILISALIPLGQSSADVSATQAAKNESQLFAVLSGGNEVSDEGQSNVGDQDARGSATVLLDRSKGTVCFGITVTGTDTPVAAHIHQASAGVNGAIVVNFTAPTGGNPGASSGCVSGVSAALLNNIKNFPTGFYVNVHTNAFPAGAVRGQLN
jgi:CHRD domain